MLIKYVAFALLLSPISVLAEHQLKIWYKFNDDKINGESINNVYQWASIAKPITYRLFTYHITKDTVSLAAFRRCLYKQSYNPLILLDHTSQYPQLTNNIFDEQAIEAQYKKALVSKPFNTYRVNYSNLNYLLIGKEMECVTGKDFKYLRQSAWSNWTKTKILPSRASKYPLPPSFDSVGNMLTSPVGLFRFAENFIKCANKECKEYPVDFDDCVFDTYCNGFYVQNVFNNKVFQHKGNLPGLETLLLIDPKNHLIILLHLNHPHNHRLFSTSSFLIILKKIYSELKLISNDNVY